MFLGSLLPKRQTLHEGFSLEPLMTIATCISHVHRSLRVTWCSRYALTKPHLAAKFRDPKVCHYTTFTTGPKNLLSACMVKPQKHGSLKRSSIAARIRSLDRRTPCSRQLECFKAANPSTKPPAPYCRDGIPPRLLLKALREGVQSRPGKVRS